MKKNKLYGGYDGKTTKNLRKGFTKNVLFSRNRSASRSQRSPCLRCGEGTGSRSKTCRKCQKGALILKARESEKARRSNG